MNPDIRLALLLAGAAVGGGLLVWLWLRPRLRTPEWEARLDAERRRADEAEARADGLREEIRQADVARASAQEHATRIPELREDLSLREAMLGEARARLEESAARVGALESTLREERRAAAERQAIVHEAQTRFADAFRALSAEALQRNNEAFLDLARVNFDQLREASRGDLDQRRQAVESLLAPVRESFERFEQRVQGLESARAGAYESLTRQVTSLRDESARLAQALGSPKSRGRWGELQLRRVVELAGMLDRCDFVEQAHADAADGRQRPDLVVRLPGSRSLVVDAKAPMSAYLESTEAEAPAEAAAKLREHAQRIREHIKALGAKAYWESFQPSPEFVVLFLPGEVFFSAALQADPELLDFAAARRVVLAGPSTLIALLKAVAHSWRQEHLHVHAVEIAALAREFHRRLGDLLASVDELGRRIEKAGEALGTTRRLLEAQTGPLAARLGALE